jgi:uncharacterized Zn finger protein
MATLIEMYQAIPRTRPTATPKEKFVKRIAKATAKKPQTVKCWLCGSRTPDTLCQKLISKELGIAVSELFPETPKDKSNEMA